MRRFQSEIDSFPIAIIFVSVQQPDRWMEILPERGCAPGPERQMSQQSAIPHPLQLARKEDTRSVAWKEPAPEPCSPSQASIRHSPFKYRQRQDTGSIRPRRKCRCMPTGADAAFRSGRSTSVCRRSFPILTVQSLTLLDAAGNSRSDRISAAQAACMPAVPREQDAGRRMSRTEAPPWSGHGRRAQSATLAREQEQRPEGASWQKDRISQ